ncbi:hypothetical protein [Streptomyces sp. NRRL S-1521]|uniref:hypothetical protein n=1 Tax=Streptomyces sp. NRRL S-1521 TaxID=1609100 RepID=UPI00131DE388|nr:hypothetical protein [Streptomyces sp. NRRL S-1521]
MTSTARSPGCSNSTLVANARAAGRAEAGNGARVNTTCVSLWLLDGAGRAERRRRALSLWDEDMRNRHQHELDTGHTPSGGGLSGAQRRAEVRAIADHLALAPLTAPRTHLRPGPAGEQNPPVGLSRKGVPPWRAETRKLSARPAVEPANEELGA